MMELIVFIFGLATGSFLNVLIDRLPRGENVTRGRSVCDHCKKPLRWFELIPLLSFFVQGARCRRCHGKLSWQYPVVELVTAVGFVVIYVSREGYGSYGIPQGLALWGSLLIFSALLVIFVADLKYQIIPDSMVVVGIVGVLLQGQAFEARQGPALWLPAFGASGFFLLLWIITRGRGMGLGDVKYAFFMGLLLGFPKIVVASYLAFLTGAFCGVILILLGQKKLKGKIAFGPFLVLGTGIALVWGEQLIEWWMKLL